VEDALRAVVLLDYLKSHARRVYVGLYGENPEERLLADVAAFLKERGGRFKDEASVLHKELSSRYKPPRPDELTKSLKTIAAQTPALSFDSGTFRKEGKPRRFVALSLEIGVDGVDGVDGVTVREG
jgi:hypothetical protein